MLESSGADRVLAMDLHANQIQRMFQIPVDHMTAMMLLPNYFIDLELDGQLVRSPQPLPEVLLAKEGRRT